MRYIKLNSWSMIMHLKFCFLFLDLAELWYFIKEYVAAFEPVYIATKSMQAKHTSLNDFYLTWMKTVMQIRRIQDNRFVEPLTEALKQRLLILKKNIVFKAALLIDPRFNYLNSRFFSPEEKDEIRVSITLWVSTHFSFMYIYIYAYIYQHIVKDNYNYENSIYVYF